MLERESDGVIFPLQVWSGDVIVNLDVLRIIIHTHFHTYSTVSACCLNDSLHFILLVFSRSKTFRCELHRLRICVIS